MSFELLAFGAHPDDVELSCGGWLALAASRGQRVGVVDLTRGERATNGTAEVRAREAFAASKVLGLHHRENLALPDAGVRDDDPEQLAAVVGVLRRIRPVLALAPWIEARHPDHEDSGRLIRRATFLAGLARHRPDLGQPWRPRRLIFYPQRHEVVPDFVVDIQETIEIKREAIDCYASQFRGSQQTLLTQSLGVEAMLTRDRYWGASIGSTYGEPYRIEGVVPIADPIAHFTRHAAPSFLVPSR